MSETTYEDYLRTESGGTVGEFQSFCLTYVNNADLSEVTSQLPVIEEVGQLSFRELLLRSYSHGDDSWDPSRLLVGLFQIGSTAALFEVNGFAGITGPLIIPLSDGRRIVSHYYSDGNANGSLKVYENRRLTATFEPQSHVSSLWAEDPDSLKALMAEVGFDAAATAGKAGSTHQRAAAFAVMERLTDVDLHPRTIADTTFAVIRIQMP